MNNKKNYQMKTLLLLLCLFVGHSIQAQTIEQHTFANVGGVLNNSSNSLQFTIGEPIIDLIGTDASLDQGFWAISGSRYTLSIDTSTMEDFEITVYPNPVKDFLTIQMNQILPYEVSIYNVLGQKVLEENMFFGGAYSNINLSTLSRGNYLVRLSIPELQINKTIKIIKN